MGYGLSEQTFDGEPAHDANHQSLEPTRTRVCVKALDFMRGLRVLTSPGQSVAFIKLDLVGHLRQVLVQVL